jgi:hypothetical protein
MPVTYTPIATTSPTSGSSITFSSISGTYTDLVLVISGRTDTARNLTMRYNGDTGSNYSATRMSGTGTSADSTRFTSQTSIPLDGYAYPTNTAGQHNAIINIMNYSNTTTFKTNIERVNNTTGGTEAFVGLWRNTAAITSVTINVVSGTWSSEATLTLYGIKSA